jgi:sulfide:quinone oxidoreductase
MKVVVAGGGVAGLEALLALSSLAGDEVDITLLSPNEEFEYRPMLVAEPFGNAEVLRFELDPLVASAGAQHVPASLVSVDAAARTASTSDGATLEYHALLLALGATPVEAVPGALTFGDTTERERFAHLLEAVGRRGTKRLAFVVPPAASWSIAAYELALLTASERDARRLQGVDLMLVTHEAAPLDLFGASTAQTVASRLEQAGVGLRTGTVVEAFSDGLLRLAGGESLEADAAVALPALEVPAIDGLPQRRHGFVQVDSTMRVAGHEHIWAAGDLTWFPIKQGGLATQQADVAAQAIAARAGAHVPYHPWQPVLRGALITGDAPEFFRSARAGGADTTATGRSLWWPPTKLAGRYLGPHIAGIAGGTRTGELADVGASPHPADDEEKHQRAVSLILAAADADARIGDFEGATKWLALVEQLNLVIPSEYVARRHEWRRHLEPGASDPAAERIDPSFAGSAAALSDLQRRVGWLREIEHTRGDEMRRHMDTFDQDMEHLIALSRQTGVLPRAGAHSKARR